MLQDEKEKLQRQFNDKRDLMEKRLRVENEDRLHSV